MKPGDFKFGTHCSWGLPRPIIKSHRRKSGRGPGLGYCSKLWAFPLFMQRLKLATSNLVHSLGLSRPIIKNTVKGCSWARGAPHYFGYPYDISATAWASDFKFGAQLGFAKAHHKVAQLYQRDRAKLDTKLIIIKVKVKTCLTSLYLASIPLAFKKKKKKVQWFKVRSKTD